MLVGVIMNLKNACVEVCDSRSMHVWWTALWWSRSTILFIDCLPYEWQSGTSDGLFLPIYPPRSMRVVLWFLTTSKFLQQVHEFFWLMLSPWIIRTLTLPPLLASLIPRTFRRYHTPTIYLPQNSHHTYLSWNFHSHSKIYCHATFHRSVHMAYITFIILIFAWTCSWHCICGKATVHNSFIHVTLDSLHIPVHRRRHPYRVISLF